MKELLLSLEGWKSFPLEIGLIIFVCLAVIVLAIVTTLCCRQFQWILDKCCCGSCVEANQEHRMAYYDLTPRELENMVS